MKNRQYLITKIHDKLHVYYDYQRLERKYSVLISIFNYKKKDSKKSEKFLTISCDLLQKTDKIKAIILNIVVY